MIRHAILSASALALVPCPSAAQARDETSPRTQVAAANRAALREPERRAFMNAVQVYPYAEGALYRLYAAPERVTDIALQPGEGVTSVAAGDTLRWTVGDTQSGSGAEQRTHILVKPFAAGLSTNLVVTTDRRTYHLELQSTADTAMMGIAWTYPQDELIALERRRTEARAVTPIASQLALENLNFNYNITGDNPWWRPLRAFDDGMKSYIEFAPSIERGDAPPLFVIGDDGEVELVNYRVAGRYYVVDRLFGAAELRLGGRKQQVVRITRTVPKRRRK